MTTPFNVQEFLPRRWFEAITAARVERPELVAQVAGGRRQRTRLTRNGRLTILAADHPGRMITRSGNDPFIMGNRWEYLGRIARIITDPTVDGLMATPEIIDDVFILEGLVREAGGPSFLDEKVLIGCMNRGGLANTAFELDDTFTAYSARALKERRLDGGKLMFRLNNDSYDAAKTVLYCADAVSALSREGLFAFLEPLPVQRTEKGWSIVMTPEALIPIVGVAQALGESSAYTWLKLPMVPEFDRVALSTTLPILALGGEAHGNPARLLGDIANVMKAGATVRGVLMGRNILFPGDGDPLTVAKAVAEVVAGAEPAEAPAAAPGMDFFTRL